MKLSSTSDMAPERKDKFQEIGSKREEHKTILFEETTRSSLIELCTMRDKPGERIIDSTGVNGRTPAILLSVPHYTIPPSSTYYQDDSIDIRTRVYAFTSCFSNRQHQPRHYNRWNLVR